MSNDKLNSHEEQAMDALLSEVLAGAVPPDLSEHILARHSDSAYKPLLVEVQEDSRSPRKRSAVRPLATVFSIVTALAASVLLLVWLQGQADQPDNQPSSLVADNQMAAATDETPGDSVARQTPALTAADEIPDAPRSRPIPKGIPLIVTDSESNANPSKGDQLNSIQIPDSQTDPEAISLVSKRVDEKWFEYWTAIGIQPTENSALPELLARLAERLDANLPPQALADAESLRAALGSAENANQIARKWLTEVTDGGLLRIDSDARGRLIDDVTEVFQGQRRLDVTLAQWFGGQDPHSSDWYAALSASGNQPMVRRIALLSMNVDLRCTQCHDAKIEGSGRQEDYWSFASFIRQSVRRDRNGQWIVSQGDSFGKPLFYELPDGRQRMVQASIPTSWVPTEEPIQDVRQWSRRIVASPQLARGVVNSLWKLVHGRRLHGGVVDTIAAPHNESLVQMEEQLADDLLQSNFDVVRSLALIVHSPATRRSVPQALKPENALLASDAELGAARDIVGAFAGALPSQAKPPISRRVDLAMRSAGGSVQSIREGNTINAQADGSGGNDGISKPRKDDAANGFPTNAGDLPVPWLRSIKGYDGRVEHLGYLAGVNQLPGDVLEVAEAMKNSPEISEQLALHRIWWLLSP